MISLDTLTATLLAGSILPLVTAAVTKYNASSGTKALVNAVLAALTGGFTALAAANGHLRWQSFLIAAYAAYVASGSAHSHLWAPLGVTDAVGQKLAPTVGLGTPVLHRERPL